MKAKVEPILWRDGTTSIRAFCGEGRCFAWNWHYHPEIELTLIIRGTGTRLVGDHSADFQAGDLVLLGPNLPHTWFSHKPGRSANSNKTIVVQFLPSVFPEAVLALPEFQGARLLLGQAGLGVKFPTDLARSLEQRMMALTEERGIEAWLELTSLLNDLSKVPGKILADAAYRNQRTFKMESRLGRIIDHIENCCDEELSLADAARFAHLTSTSFSRYFRKMTGKSFVEFRNACRLRKACQGLAESDLSILEIALACGFQNLANFNRQFRKFAGLPPREYRKLRAGAVI